MKKPISAVSLATAIFLAACVTINIYFPAAAAEQAADKIIKEIQKAPPAQEPKATEPQSDLTLWRPLFVALDLMIAPAHAAEADLSIDSPAIRKIQASMKSRFDSLLPYYDQGLIGIMSDGYLAVRDIGQVPLKDRNTLKKLVDAENGDRRSLYRAIAEANGHPEWEGDIQATFAKRWVGNARAGWWHQAQSGNWQQK